MTPQQEATIGDYLRAMTQDLATRNFPGLIFHCLELAGHTLKSLLNITSVEEEMNRDAADL